MKPIWFLFFITHVALLFVQRKRYPTVASSKEGAWTALARFWLASCGLGQRRFVIIELELPLDQSERQNPEQANRGGCGNSSHHGTQWQRKRNPAQEDPSQSVMFVAWLSGPRNIIEHFVCP